MRIGVCASVRDIPAPVGGLEFIEAPVAEALQPRDSDVAFRPALERMRRCRPPLEAVNCFLPAEAKTTGPEVDAATLDAYVAAACRRAQQINVRIIVFGSGGSRQVPEGFDRDRASRQLVEAMKRWEPVAGSRGVIIALEPLRKEECNIVNTVDEGAELVRRAACPHVRLLADTYHMACQDEPPESILRAGELIAHVHCAQRHGRVPPATGGEDLRPYLRALKDIGYDERISIEASWQDLPRQLAPAVAELRKQWETA